MKAAARLTIALMLTLAVQLRAQVPRGPATTRFEAGIAARQHEDSARAHFRAAAKEFESHWIYEPSAALYRMTGNAWLLGGDLPRAVCSYRQALLLDPDDPGAHRGLDLARSRVAYANSQDRDSLTPRRDALEWPKRQLRCWGLWIMAAANVLGWFAFSRWIVTRRPRWMLIFCIGVALSLVLATVWIGERIQRKAYDATAIAVVARPTILRSGDGPSFLPRREMPLPAGVEVRIIDSRGTWVHVELADGAAGWLPNERILRIQTLEER